jgi:ABC-2 type transport system permease protein
MKKIWIIIKREYLSRIVKKSFLFTTLLVPLLMGAAMFIMIKVGSTTKDHLKVLVVDESQLFIESIDKMNNGEDLVFKPMIESIPLDSIKKTYESLGYDALLYIPNMDIENPIPLTYYGENQPGLVTKSLIIDELSTTLKIKKLKAKGLDESFAKDIEKDIQLNIETIEGTKKGNTEVAAIFGYISGLLIYVYLLFFGSMVMRGVAEEKTNRIIEVIISSVRPFQLMVGKIVGIGLVGLTQFLLWLVLGIGVNFLIATLFKENLAEMQQMQSGVSQAADPSSRDILLGLFNGFGEVNLFRIITGFIFYFIFGYIFYGAQFAALGSAVTDEGDTQSLSFPVTIPIIVSIFLMASTLAQPNSSLAIWSSMIPFSSPIVMMARIPFGVPIGQQIASMVILVLSSVFMIWLAGRIYRIGILIQGKKISLKEIFKWMMFYHV